MDGDTLLLRVSSRLIVNYQEWKQTYKLKRIQGYYVGCAFSMRLRFRKREPSSLG